MADFPQLPPAPVQLDKEIGPDGKEMWKPTWRCFCCHDTGKIQPHLVKLIITDYDWDRDKIPICQNCNAGSNWMHLEGMVDTRIDFKICRRLDQHERENWKQTRQAWFERVKQATGELSQKMSLRPRARNHEEEQTAQYKHELARQDRHEIDQTTQTEEEEAA